MRTPASALLRAFRARIGCGQIQVPPFGLPSRTNCNPKEPCRLLVISGARVGIRKFRKHRQVAPVRQILSSTLRIFLGLKPCARPEDSFFCNDAERLIER